MLENCKFMFCAIVVLVKFTKLSISSSSHQADHSSQGLSMPSGHSKSFDHNNNTNSSSSHQADHSSQGLSMPSGHSKSFDHNNNTNSSHTVERFKIAKIDWHHIEAPATIALWILLAGFAKIGFHLSKKLSSVFPDSSLLIILGLVVGVILFFVLDDRTKFILNSDVFFLFLLPPIVLDAGYFMPSRAFFDNMGTILVFAVVGTIWNTMAIGFSLWGVGLTGLFGRETPILDIMIFASLISAVDPVAVLVVFEEIHVNEILYIIVFGESLLNDAVSVVLYRMFEGYSRIGVNNILAIDIISGLCSFFVVALGGVVVGLIWALFVSFTTKFTKHVRVLEPLFVFVMAYSAYLTAELFHLSGIIAIVFCGIAMKQYVEGNISEKSQTTVKYFLKMLSSSSETIIFMFLGLSTVTEFHVWNTAFVCLTVLFCLVYRAIGTVVLTFLVNRFRIIKLAKVDTFIMAYGGLRGAIAYGLVSALDDRLIEAKFMFLTTTIVVIYFTVFLQGMTIKPLVNFLKVKKVDHRDKTMNEQIFERIMDHFLAGIEDVATQRGSNRLREKWEHWNDHYLRPIFMRDAPQSSDIRLVRTFTKLNMKEAMAQIQKFGSLAAIPSQMSTSASQSSLHRQHSDSDLNLKASYDNPVVDMNMTAGRWTRDDEEQNSMHNEIIKAMYKPKANKKFSRHLLEDDEDTTGHFKEKHFLRRRLGGRKRSRPHLHTSGSFGNIHQHSSEVEDSMRRFSLLPSDQGSRDQPTNASRLDSERRALLLDPKTLMHLREQLLAGSNQAEQTSPSGQEKKVKFGGLVDDELKDSGAGGYSTARSESNGSVRPKIYPILEQIQEASERDLEMAEEAAVESRRESEAFASLDQEERAPVRPSFTLGGRESREDERSSREEDTSPLPETTTESEFPWKRQEVITPPRARRRSTMDIPETPAMSVSGDTPRPFDVSPSGYGESQYWKEVASDSSAKDTLSSHSGYQSPQSSADAQSPSSTSEYSTARKE